MVLIPQISRIKDHRAFRDFSWPVDLHDFGHCNLVYGWNGSGKTTLSNLFQHLGKRSDITEGTVEFQCNGRVVAGNALSTTAGLPELRVFNKDFVAASVLANETPFGLIYYFGEANVEKQKDLTRRNTEFETATARLATLQQEKVTADSRLEDFCTGQAKVIKELLTAPGGSYNNYNKADFKQQIQLMGDKAIEHLLAESDKADLKKQKDAQLLGARTLASTDYPNLIEIKAKAQTQLATKVLSRTLDHLVNNPAVAVWVKEGLALHKTDRAHVNCEFCRNTISPDRFAALEAHFNDQYELFLSSLSHECSALQATVTSLKTITLPESITVYEHLRAAYRLAREELVTAEKDLAQYLTAIIKALTYKGSRPFESLELDPFLEGQVPYAHTIAREKRKLLEYILNQHNEHSVNFQRTVADARKKLEKTLVAEAQPQSKTLEAKIIETERLTREQSIVVKELKGSISRLEQDLIEHLKPAEELSSELKSFLGRAELSFTAVDGGYTINRGGHTAKNLSEGEKTAIAFLYFLKSLRDRAFNLSRGIVVVDDPVSSLDANALFSAFGYLRERTEKAGQLFIFTHNFSFFRQVRSWFHRQLPKPKRPARFFMLTEIIEASGRRLTIGALDPLLEKFESEYHFLFSRVYAEAHRTKPAASLEEYYMLPNLGRRMLEMFLAFRYPGESGFINQQIDRTNIAPDKKVRVLRFLHTYSHGDRIDEEPHDLSVLSQTPQILREILELIEAEDSQHYTEMLKLVTPVPAAAGSI